VRRVSLAIVVGVVVGALFPLVAGAAVAGLGAVAWLALHRARSRPGLVARTSRVLERRREATPAPAPGTAAGHHPRRVRPSTTLALGAVSAGVVLAIRAFLVVDRYLLLAVAIVAGVAIGAAWHRRSARGR
jgi:hypothetical protein